MHQSYFGASFNPMTPTPISTTQHRGSQYAGAQIMFNLKDRVALVTGASQGIGRATSLALASAGACIIAAARKAERLAGSSGVGRAPDNSPRADRAVAAPLRAP